MLTNVESSTTHIVPLSTCTSVALRLDSEDYVHLRESGFSNRTRSYKFNERIIAIEQNWEQEGLVCVVWEAAVILAKYISLKMPSLQGVRVLELGAGTGLAGLVAATLGADVTITDRLGHLRCAERNIENNKHLFSNTQSILVCPLTWGKNSGELFMHEFGYFDILIGADLVYNEAVFQDLIDTLVAFNVSNMTTTILLCGKIRYRKRHRIFLQHLRKHFLYSDELSLFSDLKRIYFPSYYILQLHHK